MRDSAKKLTFGIVYNTYGMLIYFFCQWLLTIIVTRICGYEVAGQYSLAISFTNLFAFFGMFGIRGIHVSDVQRKYTDGQFYAMRVVTTSVAVLAFIIALLFTGYSMPIVLCCIAMMCFKIVDCIFDVTIGSMQRNERFDWVALSYTLRGIIPAIVFTLVLLLGLPLFVAIISMACAAIVCFLTYDLSRLKLATKEENALSLTGFRYLVKESFPLMLAGLLDTALAYIPRDAIERFLGSEMLGYYSTISIVVTVLSTLGTAAWGSLTPRLSAIWYSKNYKALWRFIGTVFAVTVGLGLIAIAAGELLGPFVFRLVFGEEILDYMYLLTPVMISALLMLINSFFHCLFIPMGKRKILLYTNAVAAVVCLAASNILVVSHGLIGACVSLSIALGVRAAFLAASLFVFLRKVERG